MTLYFGYGSNLDAEDWGAFCARRGFAEARLVPLSTALLLDEALVFDRFAASRQGGALNLRHTPGQAVEGVLFEANEAALAALDAKEGAPRAYRRTPCHVVLPDGTVRAAMTYRAAPERFHPPHPHYLSVVRRGQAAHGIAHAMMEAAAENRPAPLTIAHLFVYGTLMEGEANAHHLAGLPRLPGRIRAVLHDLGPYPAVRLGEGEVAGEVVELPLDRLAGMDALEGSEPGGAPGGHYRRSVLPVSTPRGVLRAYVYVMDEAARFPRIEGGDWRGKPGRLAAWEAYAAGKPEPER
ncbi:MAG: gamma-glutamylcyclotransferase [Roseococcus sp.]|nr:gamma-glutamylcyclotransferase [Roseococcus sp.]